MLNYIIFILAFNFSFLKVGMHGEHDIDFLNEYDLAKNVNGGVTAGSRFNLIMKMEENYDLDLLTVRLKTKSTLGTINMQEYLCSFYPNSFTSGTCEEFNSCISYVPLEIIGYKIYEFYFEDRSYKDVKYLDFYMTVNSPQTFMTVFVFPLKIFNLTDSNQLNINSYYQNSTVPGNISLYIRVKENLTDPNFRFRVWHNSNVSFELKVDGSRVFLSDRQILGKQIYELNAVLLKVDTNEIYDDYIYNVKNTGSSFPKPFLLFYVMINNPLDYLSFSIYKEEETYEEEEISENSGSKNTDNESNSIILIIIIGLLSFVILSGVGFYLFKRYKRNLLNEVEFNLINKGEIALIPEPR